jgi:hypothetical protein
MVALSLIATVLWAAIHMISGEDFDSPPEKMQKIEDSKKSRSAQTCCPVVELKQYTLHPGMRDTLIELFDRNMESPLS